MEAGLKLKCNFARKEVEYLGHLEGLKPNYRLVEAISELSTPSNISEIRRFLGLASYYQGFIARFAKIAAPLREVTQKNIPFHWTLRPSHGDPQD